MLAYNLKRYKQIAGPKWSQILGTQLASAAISWTSNESVASVKCHSAQHSLLIMTDKDVSEVIYDPVAPFEYIMAQTIVIPQKLRSHKN